MAGGPWIYAVWLLWWARVVLRGPLEKVLIGLGVFAALVQAYGYLSTGFAFGAVAIEGAYFDARPSACPVGAAHGRRARRLSLETR